MYSAKVPKVLMVWLPTPVVFTRPRGWLLEPVP